MLSERELKGRIFYHRGEVIALQARLESLEAVIDGEETAEQAAARYALDDEIGEHLDKIKTLQAELEGGDDD